MERVLASHWFWAVIIDLNCNRSANKFKYPIQNPLLLVTEPRTPDSIVSLTVMAWSLAKYQQSFEGIYCDHDQGRSEQILLHGVTSQDMALFTSILLRITNLTRLCLISAPLAVAGYSSEVDYGICRFIGNVSTGCSVMNARYMRKNPKFPSCTGNIFKPHKDFFFSNGSSSRFRADASYSVPESFFTDGRTHWTSDQPVARQLFI
jgi:hypothetical protein